MSNKYPMLDGGPIFHLSDFSVLLRRIKLKFLGSHGNAQCIDISDNNKDAVMEFDEFPNCEACESNDIQEVLRAIDGNRVVGCKNCGLWFTSPRINEKNWVRWLEADNQRNIEFTENRLRYGVALQRNIPYSFSFWWRIVRKQRQQQIKKLINLHCGVPKRLFDVGCGSGYLLKAAHDMGLQVSGNDLNRYAVQQIIELFGFDVHNGIVYELVENGIIEKSSFDIVYMNDYIEHSYHPMKDFVAAQSMLAKNGLLYVSTFCVDSDLFHRLGYKWDMLLWNHCFHFSSDTLSKMIEKSGFNIIRCNVNRVNGTVEIIAKK